MNVPPTTITANTTTTSPSSSQPFALDGPPPPLGHPARGGTVDHGHPINLVDR